MVNRYDRQSFLGADSESILRQTVVAVVGLGGGGSHIAQQLAHVGVGCCQLIDPDRIDREGTNLNRTVGATEEDVKQQALKTDCASRLVRGINSDAVVVPIPKRWQDALDDIRNCDVLFGCVDGFAERHELESFARRHLIPYIDIGMDVHRLDDQFVVSGQVILSLPGEICMRCMGLPTTGGDRPRYGDAGGRPQVIWPNGLLASLAVGIFMQLRTPWAKVHRRHALLEYDGNGQAVWTSRRLEHLAGRSCSHFPLTDLGDPFVSAQTVTS